MSVETTPLAGGPQLPQVRKIVTAIPGPKSQELAKRAASSVARTVSTTMPIFAAAAGGGVVVDVDGNSFIDFGCGIAVTTVGNAAPEVVKAVQEQAASFTHTMYATTPYEGYIAVAEKLAEITPGSFPKKAVLINSGAEAVENAVKAARAFTGRQAVVVFDRAFHGRTNLAMAMTHKANPYKVNFGPFASDIYRVSASYPYHDGLSGAEAAKQTIFEIESMIGADKVAAVVIEPIQGEGGFIVPAQGFLPALVDWCHTHGAVFVADEIQSGVARSGKMFACEYDGIEPDIITIAKGIGGGMPLSAIVGRADVMDAAQPGGLGGTFGGNPVSCAAAVAVVDLIKKNNLCGRAVEIGTIMQSRLGELAKTEKRIGDVRGRGAMQAIEVVKPGTKDPDAATAAAVCTYARAHGLIVLNCGLHGNVLRFLPPLSISDALLNEGIDVLAEAFAAAK